MDCRVKPGNDSHGYFGPRFTASARLVFAEPGLNGCCWLACGAQPDSQIMSKVAQMRPSASEKRSAESSPSAAGWHAARRPPPLDQHIGRAHPAKIGHQRKRVAVANHHTSTSVTGSAKPARCNSAPMSLRSANGATRGDTPPSHSASAAANDCRSSVSYRRRASRRATTRPASARGEFLRERARQVVDELEGERGHPRDRATSAAMATFLCRPARCVQWT